MLLSLPAETAFSKSTGCPASHLLISRKKRQFTNPERFGAQVTPPCPREGGTGPWGHRWGRRRLCAFREGGRQFLQAQVRRGFGGCHLSRVLGEAMSSPSWERAKRRQEGHLSAVQSCPPKPLDARRSPVPIPDPHPRGLGCGGRRVIKASKRDPSFCFFFLISLETESAPASEHPNGRLRGKAMIFRKFLTRV